VNLISILLVDDHELVRSGIARLIADQPDMKVIGEVSSGEEALQFIFHSLPAIIIMDAGMPGIGGIETTRVILDKLPSARVIAMSSVASGVIPAQMLRAGAQAFITSGPAWGRCSRRYGWCIAVSATSPLRWPRRWAGSIQSTW